MPFKKDGETASTLCYDCIFHDAGTCKLGNLDKFVKIGDSVRIDELGAIVEGRICPSWRNNVWQKKREGDLQELGKLVRKENALKIDAVIPFEEGDNADYLIKLLNDIVLQTYKPQNVYFLDNQTRVPPSFFINKLREYDERLNWKYTKILVPNQDIELGWEELVGQFKQKPSDYFISIPNGVSISPQYLSIIDSAYNDQLERFLLIEETSGLKVVQTQQLTNAQWGAGRILMEEHVETKEQKTYRKTTDKIKSFADSEGCKWMVRGTDFVKKVASCVLPE